MKTTRENKASLPLEELRFYPLTKNRWAAFEKLFGPRGACGGCWCMVRRLKRSEFERQKGEGNRLAMKAIVDSGIAPGMLAYYGREPVAWCSVGPREHYPTLERSRILKPIDSQKVWSVICFFVKPEYRMQGLTKEFLKAAISYAAKKKVKILEAYPIEPKKKEMPSVFAWPGLASAYRKVGFHEVARRSETRPIMRFYIE